MTQQTLAAVSDAFSKESSDGGVKRNGSHQRNEVQRASAAHPATDFDTFCLQQRDHVRYWLGAAVRDGRLSRCDLDDVLQDTLLRAWASAATCRTPAAWIIGVAENALAEYGRQQGRWRRRKERVECAEQYEHASGAGWHDDRGVWRGRPKQSEPDGPRQLLGAAALEALTARLLRVDRSGRLVEALRLHCVEGLDWLACAAKVGWSDKWLRHKRTEAGLPVSPQRRRPQCEGGA